MGTLTLLHRSPPDESVVFDRPRRITWVLGFYIIVFLLVWICAQPGSDIDHRRQALYADMGESWHRSIRHFNTMAASSAPVYVYPDPSLLGRSDLQPPQESLS